MEVYHRAVSHWMDPATVLIKGQESKSTLTDHTRWADLSESAHMMMFLDLITYLVDDILVKVDRATMAVSLEGRAPLLDHRVAEFAWRLPLRMKIMGGTGKYLLRRVLDRYVPRELLDRPKQGFAVPIGDWLRGPLRDWAEDLLDPSKLASQGVFHSAKISDKWQLHLSGAENCQHELWDILMFQAWLADGKAVT
jgi:asparagine synthase (glutamine-hydrolysing)